MQIGRVGRVHHLSGEVAAVRGGGVIELEVELTSARDVDVARRLVDTRVEAERHHVGTKVIGRVDRRASAVLQGQVLVEEDRGDVVVDRDTVSLHRQRLEQRSLLVPLVLGVGDVQSRSVSDRSDNTRHHRVGGRDLRLHIRVHVPAIKVLEISRGSALSGLADTHEHGLDRPLEGRQKHLLVGGVADARHLATVDTDQVEANTADKDVVHLGVHEDVVHVEVAHGNRIRGRQRSGDRGEVRVGGRGGRGTLNEDTLAQVSHLSQLNVNETLAEGDRDRRDRKTRVLVEPEVQGHGHLKDVRALVVGSRAEGTRRARVGVASGRAKLDGLVASRDVDKHVRDARHLRGVQADVAVGGRRGSTRDGVARAVARHKRGLLALLLSSALVVARKLGGRDLELTVEVLLRRVVLVERVTVHGERHLLEEALTGVSAPAPATSGRRHGRKTAVKHHVVEEIAELRDRELHGVTERDRTSGRANLVVLVANSRERLEVRVHEQNVRLLDVDKSRRRVAEASGNALVSDLLKTFTEQVRSHQHAVLLTIVGDQRKNTSGRHFCLL